jgi:hypothetical protein
MPSQKGFLTAGRASLRSGTILHWLAAPDKHDQDRLAEGSRNYQNEGRVNERWSCSTGSMSEGQLRQSAAESEDG